ncbi:unnamed protein product [Rotaria sordida]|uniref:EF-hand domain-containing protein n=1 Tax=Rotaria sordida TaxID=392033 RepID=A0A815CWH7_9BILA|nr:unnamed protein product [Rotaria sordida]CAF1576180.1 unnamed protein product [Rotaria sordida]
MTAPQISNDEYLQREFDKMDKDKTGKISVTEFRNLAFTNEFLRKFRSTTIDTYITELSNTTGWIIFEQFKKFMQAETHAYKNLLVIIELKQAFNEVDTNKDGLISPQEARKGIILAGERIPGRSFGHIAQMFDDNHDGQMSLEEFLNNVQKLIHK